MVEGFIGINNEFDGEEYDVRKEMLGWNIYLFDDMKWFQVEVVSLLGGKLEV